MRKLQVIIAFLGLITLMLTCQKLDLEPITKIEITNTYSGVDYIRAKCKINDLSSKKHAEFGICYSKNVQPTVNDSKIIIGVPEKAEFEIQIPDLDLDTKYYIRAYCKDGDAYVYSDIIDAKTALLTVTDFDGNTYNAISIGTQIWMNENLKVIHYRNGDAIDNINEDAAWSNSSSGAFCWYNNEIANKDIYGAMYNFYSTVDNRMLCPTGWHVPSDAEWTTLTDYLGGEEIAGGKMKEIGFAHWLKPNVDATNSSGFSAIPGGYREADGAFNSLGEEGKWWSASLNDATTAWYRYIYNTYTTLFRENFPRANGLSVRCIQGETIGLPTVTTNAISAIASTTSSCGGNVISTGGVEVTSRGVCWNTSQNPTIELITKTVEGFGTGTFSSNLTNLTPNTTYYVRSYATNSQGTTYGNQVTFKTTIQVADFDANTYNTVQIGTQLWMQENLKVTHYRNSDAIPNVTVNATWTGLTSGAYSYYNNDEGTYKATYGALYNYYSTIDNRQLCPTGWHVPNHSEWATLSTYLLGETVAGGKMKEVGTVHWLSPNTGATDESGFKGLPGGYRAYDGTFFDIRSNAHWWTSSEYSTLGAYGRVVVYDDIYVGSGWSQKVNGGSVRCLQGEGQVLPAVTTNEVIDKTSTSAVCGGNVTSDGGATIIARGVCWSTTQNPTVDLTTKTVDGNTTGVFTSSITDLTLGTTYYVRAYATNIVGTAYGNELSFTATLAIGESYQGGIIFYLTGISPNQHGLICASSDQSTNATWGCLETSIFGADETAVGSGNQNTTDIVTGCATLGIAAQICYDLTLNGYSDWFLPSFDELGLMNTNLYLNGLGGFSVYYYWSSTENSSTFAGSYCIGCGGGGSLIKGNPSYVRAVRAF